MIAKKAYDNMFHVKHFLLKNDLQDIDVSRETFIKIL